MTKVNGENIFHYQKNDAIPKIFWDNCFREIAEMTKEKTDEVKKALIELRKNISIHNSCFPTAFADGAESCGHPNPCKGHIQISDYIMCVMNNPHNANKFQVVRSVPWNYGRYNEIPDFYPLMSEMIWGQVICRYEKDISFNEYCGYIDHRYCICYPMTGHVVVGKGYEVENKKKFIIYNDPFRKPNMVMPARTLGWGVVISPYV